jgi:hypothetical protein
MVPEQVAVAVALAVILILTAVLAKADLADRLKLHLFAVTVNILPAAVAEE